MKEAGQGPKSIAEILGIHRATVYRWLRRYEETDGVKRQKGSGRPRKSTPDEDMALIRAAEDSRFSSAKEIAGILSFLVLN